MPLLTHIFFALSNPRGAELGKQVRAFLCARRRHVCSLQVISDEALAGTLLHSPLVVTLFHQGHARKGVQAPQPVPLGTAEVDLSSLRQPRSASCFSPNSHS